MKETDLKVDSNKIVTTLIALGEIDLATFKSSYDSLNTYERHYFITNLLDNIKNVFTAPFSEDFESFLLDCAEYKVANRKGFSSKYFKNDEIEEVSKVNSKINESTIDVTYKELFEKSKGTEIYQSIFDRIMKNNDSDYELNKFKEFTNA